MRARRKRSRGGLPSILWSPIPIINIKYSALADRAFGYASETLVYDVYTINAAHDFDHVLTRWRRNPLTRHLVPYAALVWAVVRFDIFSVFFDGGLLAPTPFWRLELYLLRLAGKKIIVYPYGSDARLPSLTRKADRWNAFTDVPPGQEERTEESVKAHIDAFARHADVMLGCNDIAADLPRMDGVFRYPFDTDGWVQAPPPPDRRTVTVVHAANHRHYKGTRFVISAVERLRAEGLPVDLVLLEGVPREEVKSACERASIVASDFLIGGYAMFAIEALALAKPVLAYLPDRLRPFHPEWAEAPIVNASPATLVDELRRLVEDPVKRHTLGMRGPAYVEKYHSLASVGRDMDRIYRKLWFG